MSIPRGEARFFVGMTLTTFRYTLPFLLSLALLPGCEKNNLGTVDVPSAVPFIESAEVSPDSTNVDLLTPTNGIYAVPLTLRMRVSDAALVQSASADLVRPSSSDSIARADLLDNGVSPDMTPGDGIFSGTTTLFLRRVETGQYRLVFSAIAPGGLTSNAVSRSFHASRRNAPPWLSNLVAPDTVDLPIGGQVTVRMAVSASDSDGLADIRQVYFRSLTSSNPDFKFFLKDDGGLDPPGPFGVGSGDSVAGDGRYAILIPLIDGQAQRRTNLFAFQALDRFGDTSRTVNHFLTVQ